MPANKELDFSRISWQSFEKLIRDLMNEVHKGFQFMLYGKEKGPQAGVDVLGHNQEQDFYIAVQCKRDSGLSPQEINDLFKGIKEKFLAEAPYKKKHGAFILCVSFDRLSKKTQDQWLLEAEALKREHGYGSAFWNGEKISRLLENFPETVARYWDADTAERHRPEMPFRAKYPRRYQAARVECRGELVIIEDYLLRFNMYPPLASDRTVSGLFLFARHDLQGHQISCQGRNLVRLLQEKAHAASLLDIDRYQVHIREDDKIMVRFFDHHLSLEKEDIPHFSWVLDKAWELYFKKATELADLWSTQSFRRRADKEKYGFELCRLANWFCCKIVNYVKENPYFAEDGYEYYIYASAGGLSVSAPGIQSDFEGRLLLNIEINAATGDVSGDKILSWRPPERNNQISLQTAWDAQYAHSWLTGRLFPRVYERLREKNRPRLKFPRLRLGAAKKEDDLPPLNSCFTSFENRSLDYPVKDQKSVVRLVDAMQSYYCNYSRAGIEKELTRKVLNLTADLIGPASICDEPYIRGKLNLPPEIDVYLGLKQLAEDKDGKFLPDASNLELSLRALKAALEFKDADQPGWPAFISAGLKPVYNRYREDLICDSYF